MTALPGARLSRARGVCRVPGVRLGHAELTGAGTLSGTTALLLPSGTVAGVDVRGGGPATHETDLLAPGTLSAGCDALVLTGGSAFGLAAAGGVQQVLAEAGRGFPAPGLPGVRVPLVPAAAIFDLGRGGAACLPPDAQTGRQAALAALASGPEAVERGSCGAGTGAWTGRGLLRGGLGSAVIETAGGATVAAIAAANPMGSIISPAGRLYAAEVLADYGIALPVPDSRVIAERFAALAAGQPGRQPADGSAEQPADESAEQPADESASESAGGSGHGSAARNTTIAIVVTDANLDAAQVTRLAQSAHAGLARAIHPSHTLFDGDTVFAAATGRRPLSATPDDAVLRLVELGAAAADALTAAIVDALMCAQDYPDGPPTPLSPPPLSALCPQLTEAWQALD